MLICSTANNQAIPLLLWSTEIFGIECRNPLTSSLLPSQLQIINSPRTSPYHGQPPQRRLQHKVVIGLPQTPVEGKLPSLASLVYCLPTTLSTLICRDTASALGREQKHNAGSRPLLALVVLTWFCIRHFQWLQSCAIDDSSAGWLESCLIVCNLQATLKLDLC